MRIKPWIWTVPLVVGLGFLSGWLSGSGSGDPWFASLRKPAWTPPGPVFPIVWSILYAMMGVVLARLIEARAWRATALFGLQLALNLAWSPVFFGAHDPEDALILIQLLDVVVLATIVAAWKADRPAAWLLLPYAGWLALATALNLAIVRLNG